MYIFNLLSIFSMKQGDTISPNLSLHLYNAATIGFGFILGPHAYMNHKPAGIKGYGMDKVYKYM